MKTALTVLLLLTALTVQSQRNSYYLTVQPGDIGIGVRYDHNHLYGTGYWGNYRFPSGSYINNHIRLSGGYKFDLPKQIGCHVINNLSAGLVFHHYGERAVYDFEFNQQEGLFPISLELGTGVRINRFVAAGRLDVIKWECAIDIGITFR